MINMFTVVAEVVDKLDKLFDLLRGIEDPELETTPEMFSTARLLISEIKGIFGKGA